MRAFLFAWGIGILTAGVAVAQQPAPLQRTPPAPPSRTLPDAPRAQPDYRHQPRIDQLFERLAASRDEAEGGNIAEQIARIWSRSGSDTLDLLLERAGQALQGREHVTALDLIDSIIALKPDWAEAYSRRGAVLFQMKDMDGAMRDLRQALALEPRQFQALAGVGMILNQNGQPKQALKAFEAALAIHPHFKGIRQAAERLALEHGGQGI